MLELVDAKDEYLEQYKEAYELTNKKIEEGIIKRHNQMFFNPDEVDIVEKYVNSRDPSKIPSHYVPAYEFFIVNDDLFIGTISIRTKLTEKLLQYGGHIGYGINPLYWKKGYGTKALALALDKAKNLVEENKILITCDDDNIGSYKIIESNGGILENKVQNEDRGETFLTRRYWIKK